MGNRTRRTAGDVLLELLGKVPDATTLEILLEPEHLLTLLRARGHADDAIRAQLRAGEKLPGELLLDVLAAQPDTHVLLAELGNPAPRPPAKGALSSGPRPPTAASIGLLVFGAVLAFPAGFYLFVRLDFLNAPGLLLHFPGAYVLVFAMIFSGVAAMVKGVAGLVRSR